MGSISHVYRKQHWKIISEGKFISNQETAYEVKIGEWDDYGSNGYLKVWMAKEVYDKVINGEYDVISQAYSDPPILIQDKDGNNKNLLG